jgi:hypothetical protein
MKLKYILSVFVQVLSGRFNGSLDGRREIQFYLTRLRGKGSALAKLAEMAMEILSPRRSFWPAPAQSASPAVLAPVAS